MESVKYIPFMIQFTLIIFALDAYFLATWRKTVRKANWNNLLYKVPVSVGIFMAFISLYTIWVQIANILPGNTEKLLFDLQSVWYLPKALITPVLLFRDLWRLGKKLLNGKSSFNRNKSSQHFILPTPELSFQRQFAFQTPTNTNHYSEYKADDMITTDERNFQTVGSVNNNDLSRRKFVKNSTWALAGIPFVVVSRGALETTYEFGVHQAEIPIFNLPNELEGLKIIQISDIHAGSFHSANPLNDVVGIINRLKPDIVAITGDFVNYHYEEYQIIGSAISRIQAKYGVYGCLGNHDHFMSACDTDLLRKEIRKSNINLLDNSNDVIKIGSSKLKIAGVDNSGYGQIFADFDKATQGLDEDFPKILLCHDPTNWDKSIKEKRNVDLMLSGHTHGGQAGINIAGTLLTPAMLVYKQFAGLYKHGNQYLYINRGLGNSGIPIRVGIPPEITQITLKKCNYIS